MGGGGLLEGVVCGFGRDTLVRSSTLRVRDESWGE